MIISIFAIVLIAVVAGARLAMPRRTILPSVAPRHQPDARIASVAVRKPSASDRAARPAQDPIAVRSPAYLLSDRHPGGALDRTAMVLDSMAGPGVCTPRTG